MDTAYYVLSAHAHNLAQYVGKGRQQPARDRICVIELSDHRYALILILHAARVGYVLYRALVHCRNHFFSYLVFNKGITH